MPFPLIPVIASLFLSGLSAGANALGQRQADKARDSTLEAERIRQARLDQEAAALNVQSQDRYQDFSGKQDVRAKQIGDYLVDQSTAPVASMMPTSSSSIVLGEQAKQDATAAGYVGQQGRALGELRGFGDLLGTTTMLQSRDAGQIDQIGGFKRGSASVLPYELDDASRKGGGFKMLGDLAALGATVVGGMGGAPGALPTGVPTGPAIGSFRAAQQAGMPVPGRNPIASLFGLGSLLGR